MGLCRDRSVQTQNRNPRSIEEYPIDRCVEHQNNIESCVYEIGKQCVQTENIN